MLKRFAATTLALALSLQIVSVAPTFAAPLPAPQHAVITVNATQNVEDEVRAIVAEQLGVAKEKVTLDARFREDLDANEIDLVELIMAFEESFGIEISDADAQKITTVGEAVTYIEANL